MRSRLQPLIVLCVAIALGAGLLVTRVGPSAAQSASGRARAVEAGARAFQACAACHHDRPDAAGPELRGVVDRVSGTVAGFRYSPAMKRARVVWTLDNLRAFLRDPQGVVRGNRMPISGLTDAQQIEDVLAYLRTLSPSFSQKSE